MDSTNALPTVLNLILGAGFATFIVAVVSAIRKIKSGEIVDDDAVIMRLDKDNENLRDQLASEKTELARYRRLVFAWQDQAARYRLQLIQREIDPDDLKVWDNEF